VNIKINLEVREGAGTTQNWYRSAVGSSTLFEGFESELTVVQRDWVKSVVETYGEEIIRFSNKIRK